MPPRKRKTTDDDTPASGRPVSRRGSLAGPRRARRVWRPAETSTSPAPGHASPAAPTFSDDGDD